LGQFWPGCLTEMIRIRFNILQALNINGSDFL
jgi:hypothetical protein